MKRTDPDPWALLNPGWLRIPRRQSLIKREYNPHISSNNTGFCVSHWVWKGFHLCTRNSNCLGLQIWDCEGKNLLVKWSHRYRNSKYESPLDMANLSKSWCFKLTLLPSRVTWLVSLPLETVFPPSSRTADGLQNQRGHASRGPKSLKSPGASPAIPAAAYWVFNPTRLPLGKGARGVSCPTCFSGEGFLSWSPSPPSNAQYSLLFYYRIPLPNAVMVAGSTSDSFCLSSTTAFVVLVLLVLE